MTRGSVATLGFGVQSFAKSDVFGVTRNDAARIYALAVGSEDDVVDSDYIARLEALDKIGGAGIAQRCSATAVEYEAVIRNFCITCAVGLGGYDNLKGSAGGEFLALGKFDSHFVATAGAVALVGAAPVARSVQSQALIDTCVVDALEGRGQVAASGCALVVVQMVDVGYAAHIVYKLIPLIVSGIYLVFDGARAGRRAHLRGSVGGCTAGPIEVTVGAGKIKQTVLGVRSGHSRSTGCSGDLVRTADRTYGYAGSGYVYGKVEYVEGAGTFESQLRLRGAGADLGVE